MRYTHLDHIVNMYREAFSLPDYNPRVTTHMHTLDVRHESFTRMGGQCNFLMFRMSIDTENYTCFANAMLDQLHIVHEPSKQYNPLKEYEAPHLEEQVNAILSKSKK